MHSRCTRIHASHGSETATPPIGSITAEAAMLSVVRTPVEKRQASEPQLAYAFGLLCPFFVVVVQSPDLDMWGMLCRDVLVAFV